VFVRPWKHTWENATGHKKPRLENIPAKTAQNQNLARNLYLASKHDIVCPLVDRQKTMHPKFASIVSFTTVSLLTVVQGSLKKMDFIMRDTHPPFTTSEGV
jgi:hypothetical protein